MIDQEWQDVLGVGLAVTLSLPLSPSMRAITPDDAAVHFLDAVSALEDGGQGHAKEEPPPPEFQRLESKIDLLMYLLSAALWDRIPPPVTIRMSNEGLVLPASVLPVECDRIELYPSTWLSYPLVLEIAPGPIRGETRGARWSARDGLFRDALTRWVFRMHRRDIARQRRRVDDG